VTKLLHRQSFFCLLAFIVCLAGMLGMFVAADLFENLDEIADQHRAAELTGAICRHCLVQSAIVLPWLAATSVFVAVLFTAIRRRLAVTGGPRP
jgi:hypothetical protein